MDRRRQPERGADTSPGPPFSTPSHLLRDVSNLKTPRPCSRNPNPNPNLASPSPLFFTASKKTPYLSYSTSTSFTPHSRLQHRTSSNTATVSRSKTAQRLKALQLEQSQSARKTQVRCRKTLESFARSLAAWLNFLLQNPKECGCNVGPWAADDQPLGSFSKGKGKRESLDGGIVEIGRKWRSPKRQRVQTHAGINVNVSLVEPMTLLKKSLCKVCSLDDMLERMTSHMSSKSSYPLDPRILPSPAPKESLLREIFRYARARLDSAFSSLNTEGRRLIFAFSLPRHFHDLPCPTFRLQPSNQRPVPTSPLPIGSPPLALFNLRTQRKAPDLLPPLTIQLRPTKLLPSASTPKIESLA